MADLAAPQLSWDLVADLQQLLAYHFMRNALAAATAVALLAGLIGHFMVLRGQSFAGHTLSQVGFPGAAGAVLAGAAPLYGLLVACVAAALGIAALSRPEAAERRGEGAAIGSILAFSLALGFLFASLYGGFIAGVGAYLFGTFLGITDDQVLTLVAIAAAVTLALAAIGRPLLFASVDPTAAAARGVPVRPLSALFLLILGLAVAAAALITGTLLVFALLVTPAAVAQQLTARPWLGLGLSVALALAFAWLGVGLAYFSVYPVGFFVTSIAFGAYLAVRAVRWLAGWRRRVVRAAGAAA